MFGLQSMVDEVLKQNGISIEEVKKAAIEGYQNVMLFVNETQRSQSEISNILKISLDMQRVNAAKLDAIMSHLNIKIDEEKTNGQETIQFKQQ